ncbi:MAG: cold shock domain-containing protein [Alphaproteobacteria bacterium]|nr:cold shock domain-containing protein [Alphaproteobacteria bacterium]
MYYTRISARLQVALRPGGAHVRRGAPARASSFCVFRGSRRCAVSGLEKVVMKEVEYPAASAEGLSSEESDEHESFNEPSGADDTETAAASASAGSGAPSPAPVTSPNAVAGVIRGEVKWFNPSKGFGFVRVGEGSRDAFLHASSLTEHGVSVLHPGAEVTCILVEGARGLQVESLVSIESEGEPQEGAGRYGDERRPPAGPLREVDGTVKFFNARKGFGFVAPDEGGADVFLPARVLTRCGIMNVQQDQRLRMQVRAGLRGLAAESVKEI